MTAATLAQRIDDAAVPWAEIDDEYRPILVMVQELIGVVPNCDPILEIWPPAFRSYNLFVPNMLNLPASIFGQGVPKDLLGLAMYTASRAAECMYCSAHTCSFALRRGTSPEALTGTYNEVEQAVATLAEAVSAIPPYLHHSHIEQARRHLSDEDVEWLVLGAAMMGFLNKFMDTMGIELEDAAIHDVAELIGPTGWSAGKHAWSTEFDEFGYGYEDQQAGRPLTPSPGGYDPYGDGYGYGSGGGYDQGHGPNGHVPGYAEVPVDNLGTYLRVMRQAPTAIRRRRQWTKGLPPRVGPALIALETTVGYSFPILASIRQARPVQAIAAALRENLDPAQTVVGLDSKILAGLVFARVVGNDQLTAEAVQLAEILAPGLDPNLVAAVGKFADTNTLDAALPPGLTSRQAAAVMLAKVAAPSPSEVNEISVDMAANSLDPPEIVEIVVWISIQQLLHRLYVYYDVVNRID